MIDDKLVKRFNNYKEYIKSSNHKYGEYWTREANTFNVELNSFGYSNQGERDYLPRIFSNQDNLQDVNDFQSPFENSDKKTMFLTIGSIDFCNPITAGNATLRYAKYYDEIIEGSISKLENNTVLEIGGGSGVFSALMQDRFDCKTIIVDIPYSIQNSIALFMTIYPNKTFILPNEITDETNIYDYDLIFLTPDQLDHVKDDSVGLAINTQSFMEMDYSEIENYFTFVNEKIANGGYFFISNRMRKFNNFFNYPFSLLSQFKRMYLERNNVFLRHYRMSTLIDCLLIKDTKLKKSSKVFNTIYKFYLNAFWMTREERYGWIRSDVIRILRKIGMNVSKD